MPVKRAKSKERDTGWRDIKRNRTVAGHPVVYFSTTDSTNDKCMEMGLTGAQTGTLVLAETQTGGKGRLGRSWFSSEGDGLYFSLLLRPVLQPQDLSKITLAAGVALCNAVSRLYPLAPMLKWPNDLLIHGQKCGGILVEADLQSPSSPLVILGVGLNVTTPLVAFPRDLHGKATSLENHVAGDVNRSELLTVIIEEIDAVISEFERQGFAAILKKWKKYDATLGKKLTWLTSDYRKIEGISLGPDDEGCLHIKDEQGSIHEVLSGDIQLNP